MASIIPKTTLDKLPIDVLREIVCLVDAESLGQLFSTLNLKMQSLLSHPNLFSSLCIQRDSKKTRAGPYHYFVSAVRSVDSLELGPLAFWSLRSLLHLKTLNPRHLVITGYLLPHNARKLLLDPQQDPELRALAQNWIPLDLPTLFCLVRTITCPISHPDLSQAQGRHRRGLPLFRLPEYPHASRPLQLLRNSHQYPAPLSQARPSHYARLWNGSFYRRSTRPWYTSQYPHLSHARHSDVAILRQYTCSC